MNHRDASFAWKYHDLTKHSYWSVRTSAHYLDWANRPSPFKVYKDIEPEPLPKNLIPVKVSALQALASTSIKADIATKPDLEKLASLLYNSTGITKTKTFPGGEIYFRAAACAGALYPVEVYVVCGDIEGLRAGVYHFNPLEFTLIKLRDGDHRGALAEATANNPAIASAPVTLIYTAITWRSSWKYRDRSYRYHFWDNGMILANALAMATVHGLSAEAVMGFRESKVNALIGIDGQRELALSLLPLGSEEDKPAPGDSKKDLPKLNLETEPLSFSEVDYPSIREMHDASTLTDEVEVIAWRSARIDREIPEAAGETFTLDLSKADRLPDEAIDDVILRRASTRRFARKSLPFADLSVMLDRATQAIPADFLYPAGTRLNDIYLIVNRVEGLPPGAYFYRKDERALELLNPGDFSEKAAYLALDQQLAGDASVTFFFMADLVPLLYAFGNRGYRAVQVEAGIIGGKLYLAAYSLGRGATGLTFYDDDVTNFFSPHAAGKSCIFITSVGIPGKRPLF